MVQHNGSRRDVEGPTGGEPAARPRTPRIVVPGRVRPSTPARGGSRRPSSRPSPVRPAVTAVGVRPLQVERPVCRTAPVRSGQRLLDRRSPAPVALPRGDRVRRVVGAVALALVAAVVVLGLGLLAGAAAQARGAEPVGPSAPAGVLVGELSGPGGPAAGGPAG